MSSSGPGSSELNSDRSMTMAADAPNPTADGARRQRRPPALDVVAAAVVAGQTLTEGDDSLMASSEPEIDDRQRSAAVPAGRHRDVGDGDQHQRLPAGVDRERVEHPAGRHRLVDLEADVGGVEPAAVTAEHVHPKERVAVPPTCDSVGRDLGRPQRANAQLRDHDDLVRSWPANGTATGAGALADESRCGVDTGNDTVGGAGVDEEADRLAGDLTVDEQLLRVSVGRVVVDDVEADRRHEASIRRLLNVHRWCHQRRWRPRALGIRPAAAQNEGSIRAAPRPRRGRGCRL